MLLCILNCLSVKWTSRLQTSLTFVKLGSRLISIEPLQWLLPKLQYRLFHQLSDLGWVDLDLGCSIILLSCAVISAKIPSAQAEEDKQQDQSLLNQDPRADGTPCTYQAENLLSYWLFSGPTGGNPLRRTLQLGHGKVIYQSATFSQFYYRVGGVDVAQEMERN